MADVARIPRRRGGLCGLLLIVLGAWGALAPFIGPYFRYAFTPDKTWHYTSGRLYLSLLPGAVAVLAGLVVLGTRSRAAGMLGGLVAAAAGAWFIVGAAIVSTVLHHYSIQPGLAVVHRGASASSAATWKFLEQLGFFTGTGILIIFFGAIVIGRFSMISARDAATADSGAYPAAPDVPEEDPAAPADTQDYPVTTSGQFPTASQFPTRPFPGDEPTSQLPVTGSAPTSTAGATAAPSPSGQAPEAES